MNLYDNTHIIIQHRIQFNENQFIYSNIHDKVKWDIKHSCLHISSSVWNNAFGPVEEVIGNNIWDNVLTFNYDKSNYCSVTYKTKSNILKAFK